MKKTGRQKRRRQALWRKDKHCYWCGVETVPPHGFTSKAFDNMATLDHLRTKLDTNRSEPNPHGKEIRTVLACHKCNTSRGKERLKYWRLEGEYRCEGAD